MVWNLRAALNVAALQCQFGPTLLTLPNYNAIDDANLLFVGQELVIDGDVPAPDEPEVNPNC